MKEFEDWRDITYLKLGTAVQREVYALLVDLNIMQLLADYHPVLVGTVPLGIQVEGSDLDIICEVHDLEAFAARVSLHFGRMDDYCWKSRLVRGMPRIKINFTAGGWPIELFGQPRETNLQNGYLHMRVEAKLLDLLGDPFRRQIIGLKSGGLKTEPAFAQLLQLEGDPYDALLALSGLAPRELEAVCKGFVPGTRDNQMDDKGVVIMGMQIRKAVKGDVPELCRLMEQLKGKPLPVEEMERRLDFIEDSPLEELYVCAEDEGKGKGVKKDRLLGVLGFRLRENIEDLTRYGEVSLLVTDKEIRRRGVGRQLMEYAERLSSERGCIGTWLVSSIGREQEAHVFYKELGYEITGYRFVKKAGEQH